MAPDTYGEILARNIRAARSRVDIGQENLAVRMRALGFSAWIRQTVGSTEHGRRRPTAEEIFGLAIALETSGKRLTSPLWEDKQIELPDGRPLSVALVEGYVTGEWTTDERIHWHQDAPVLNPAPGKVGET